LGDRKDGACRASQAFRPVLFAALMGSGECFLMWLFYPHFWRIQLKYWYFQDGLTIPFHTFEPWWPHYQAIYFEEFRYCNRPMVNLLLSIFVNSLFSNFLLGLLSTIFQLFVGLTTTFPSWQSNSIQIRNSPFFVG
jgi:hypothetical protein